MVGPREGGSVGVIECTFEGDWDRLIVGPKVGVFVGNRIALVGGGVSIRTFVGEFDVSCSSSDFLHWQYEPSPAHSFPDCVAQNVFSQQLSVSNVQSVKSGKQDDTGFIHSTKPPHPLQLLSDSPHHPSLQFKYFKSKQHAISGVGALEGATVTELVGDDVGHQAGKVCISESLQTTFVIHSFDIPILL